MQSPSSTDASLSLLKETVAYLRRLPANPATTEMIRKIDSYLAGAGNEAAVMRFAMAEIIRLRAAAPTGAK